MAAVLGRMAARSRYVSTLCTATVRMAVMYALHNKAYIMACKRVGRVTLWLVGGAMCAHAFPKLALMNESEVLRQ